MNPYEIIHLKVNIETEFVIVESRVLKGLVKHFHFLIYWYICCTYFTMLPDILKYENLCKNATQISGKMYRKEIPPKFLPHVECLVYNHLTQKNLRSCVGIYSLYLSSKWFKNINDIHDSTSLDYQEENVVIIYQLIEMGAIIPSYVKCNIVRCARTLLYWWRFW